MIIRAQHSLLFTANREVVVRSWSMWFYNDVVWNMWSNISGKENTNKRNYLFFVHTQMKDL